MCSKANIDPICPIRFNAILFAYAIAVPGDRGNLHKFSPSRICMDYAKKKFKKSKCWNRTPVTGGALPVQAEWLEKANGSRAAIIGWSLPISRAFLEEQKDICGR